MPSKSIACLLLICGELADRGEIRISVMMYI
jgi:hypothetical protein